MSRTSTFSGLELFLVFGVAQAAILAVANGILNSRAGTERPEAEAALRVEAGR